MAIAENVNAINLHGQVSFMGNIEEATMKIAQRLIDFRLIRDNVTIQEVESQVRNVLEDLDFQEKRKTDRFFHGDKMF